MAKPVKFSDFRKQTEKGMIASAHLFLGEEDFVKKEALELLTQKLIPSGLESFNLNYLDAEETEIPDLINLASTVPVGSERRLVIVKTVEKLKAAPKEQLSIFLPKIPKTTCLVLLATDLSEKDKLYTAVSNSGVIVQFTDFKGASLSKWIAEQFATKQKKIDSQALKFLEETGGNNLNLLSREIEKIVTYAGERENIKKENIEKVAVASEKWKVYQLADQIVQKDTQKAWGTLDEILLYGETPSTVNYWISEHFVGLLRTKSYPKRDWAGLADYLSLGKRAFMARKYSEQVKNFSHSQLERAVGYLYQTELDLRSNLSSPKISLEVLIFNLTHL
ncbi:MAG TPA: DNA polymerase III subunit delta [candidate division Zixibacteria bacterium]|nr:DNA polymerase III subunit delta [candidate division Zixibacteria bacterium]